MKHTYNKRTMKSLYAVITGIAITGIACNSQVPLIGSSASALTSAPLAQDDSEQKILKVLESMNPGRIAVSRDDGRFLRLMAESIGAKHVVEVGTLYGYSGIWLCMALRTTDGRLTTYEIDPKNAQLARENFKRAGVDSMVTWVEGDAHQEVLKLKDPIDLLFLEDRVRDSLDEVRVLAQTDGIAVSLLECERVAVSGDRPRLW